MSTTSRQPDNGRASRSATTSNWKQCVSGLIVAAVAIGFWGGAARAEDHPDDQYIHIYTMIVEADMMTARGQTNLARAKFEQASRELRNFQVAHPDWRVNAVSYRAGYVADRIAALAEPPSAPSGSSGVTNAPPAAPPAAPPETNSVPAASSPQPQAEAN